MLSREMQEWCELVGTSSVVELHVFLAAGDGLLPVSSSQEPYQNVRVFENAVTGWI